jgi:hypothetical protein
MVRSKHERHVTVAVAGVDVGALIDQLLDLFEVFEADLAVVALVFVKRGLIWVRGRSLKTGLVGFVQFSGCYSFGL